MGTNYYLHNTFDHLKDEPPLHIGKSSYGWVFALHQIPELGLNSLEAWLNQFNRPGNIIFDEYRTEISKEDMIEKITRRKRNYKLFYFDTETLKQRVAPPGKTFTLVPGDFS